MRKRTRGLTRVETVILGVIMAAALTGEVFLLGLRERSRRAAVNEDLRQILGAMTSYEASSGDFFPSEFVPDTDSFLWDGVNAREAERDALRRP